MNTHDFWDEDSERKNMIQLVWILFQAYPGLLVILQALGVAGNNALRGVENYPQHSSGLWSPICVKLNYIIVAMTKHQLLRSLLCSWAV